jgi:hypothetical protein
MTTNTYLELEKGMRAIFSKKLKQTIILPFLVFSTLLFYF